MQNSGDIETNEHWPQLLRTWVRKSYFSNFSSKIYATDHSRQENMVDSEQVHAIAKKNHYRGNLLTFICSTSHVFGNCSPLPSELPFCCTESQGHSPPHQPMFAWTETHNLGQPDPLSWHFGQRHRVLKAITAKSHSACVLWILPSKNIAVIYWLLWWESVHWPSSGYSRGQVAQLFL